jgi:hypothetical protein
MLMLMLLWFWLKNEDVPEMIATEVPSNLAHSASALQLNMLPTMRERTSPRCLD